VVFGRSCPLRSIYHPITFDWGCIFSPFWQYRHHPIAPGYPVDEELNNSIRQGFIRARENLRGTILYPVISHKTVGVEARQNVEEFSKMFDRDTDRPRYSLWDCEKIYHRYGIEVSGRTEVRWAWKFNDLKPRIYSRFGVRSTGSSGWSSFSPILTDISVAILGTLESLVYPVRYQ